MRKRQGFAWNEKQPEHAARGVRVREDEQAYEQAHDERRTRPRTHGYRLYGRAMNADDDECIILCLPVWAYPTTVDATAVQLPCSRCAAPVWVARSSMRRATRICFRCFKDTCDPQARLMIAPEQEAELAEHGMLDFARALVERYNNRRP